MDPATAEPNSGHETVVDDDLLVHGNLAEAGEVGQEEDEDTDDDDFDDEDEDDEEDDDVDGDDDDEDEDEEDDDVATDEDGKEILKMQAEPNVDSDRVPSTDAEPEGSLDNVKTAPLGIQEIENMEDDAKGG